MSRWAARAGFFLLVFALCGALLIPDSQTFVWPLKAGDPLLLAMLMLVVWVVLAIVVISFLAGVLHVLAKKGWGE